MKWFVMLALVVGSLATGKVQASVSSKAEIETAMELISAAQSSDEGDEITAADLEVDKRRRHYRDYCYSDWDCGRGKVCDGGYCYNRNNSSPYPGYGYCSDSGARCGKKWPACCSGVCLKLSGSHNDTCR